MEYTGNMMKTININKREGMKLLKFPDNQPHVHISNTDNTYMYKVICSLLDPSNLLELAEVADALEENGVYKELHIPYLMGARYDRRMNGEGDSFDLKVIAKIVNSLKFDRVHLYDPHSDVSAALIERSRVITNRILVEAYDKEEATLIIPDAGAEKKAQQYRLWNSNIWDEAHCIKHRDTTTGKVELEVLNLDKCKGENCVIIDDICDGGATFNMIAEQIYPLSLTLIVTHGIFSKGFEELEKNFNEIITSNSRFTQYSSPIVKVINYEY